MTAAQREIFNSALEITDVAERMALLDQACASQPELRERIEALLAAHNEADHSSGCVAAVAGSVREIIPAENSNDPATEDLIGSKIGPYKLLQKLAKAGGAWCSWRNRSRRCAAASR